MTEVVQQQTRSNVRSCSKSVPRWVEEAFLLLAIVASILQPLNFSGGPSVQEYPTATTNTVSVEFIRGSDYGGGVGGILYSIRNSVDSFTHANKRGDVVSKTNSSGTVTFQSQYQAFGTQTVTTGSTLDRQKDNSKDTDPWGGINDGMRYTTIEGGVRIFATRDPAGFVDGPNMYSYVRENPWTSFDPEGLEEQKTNKPTKSAYVVERPLAGDNPKENAANEKRFDRKDVAHIYLEIEKDGKPEATYSWHPESWATRAF
jgi:RHS repeat-associated protein